ncbi:PREDICTED: NADH dehydrogenase [ubiquinone] 1 alpha subcomplex subunit 11 [Thamnophis sirtalis]|uniref:NADH dehydrogenase [ubiquinone] 1 alpha subcomplex subunit 11 n=1 Tax=Thamnophis sirtalis TaxID=35019 RepID=A0A6I9Y9C5_9SAUR|nr:PREDICTED: NADH dehydrogenase [ubiquinone] 1 alpha subcomplex subunit 11 [Thamnophis sirtalis]
MSVHREILDDTNCFRKTWLAGRLGALTGLIGSTYHVILYSPDTYLEGLMRVAKSTVTMATLGAVFGATSCISGELRGAPEDPMNYFIGGCASGIMIGARQKNFLIGTSSCLGLGMLGAFAKVVRREGWNFYIYPEK